MQCLEKEFGHSFPIAVPNTAACEQGGCSTASPYGVHSRTNLVMPYSRLTDPLPPLSHLCLLFLLPFYPALFIPGEGLVTS